MKKLLNSYPLVLFGETIGAKETLSEKNRYKLLSICLKVLSAVKSDEEIWEFYQWRKNGYKNIRLFTSFMLVFLLIMTHVLFGSLILTVSVGFAFLVVYGFIAASVKVERNYAYLWDDKALFMKFLKLNKSELFNPEKFDQLLRRDKVEPKTNELTFQEELSILKNETNTFNSIQMEAVIKFFDIIRESADYPDELKCVQISDKDFIRFIKSRFVDNSKDRLDIELIKEDKSIKGAKGTKRPRDKSDIKALFFIFFQYSTTYFGYPKKGKAKAYMDLYLNSFAIFENIDYDNFTDLNALEFSTPIKRFNKMQ